MESYNYADLLGQENRWRVVQYKNYKFDFIKEEDDNNESCICPQNGFLHCNKGQRYDDDEMGYANIIRENISLDTLMERY